MSRHWTQEQREQFMRLAYVERMGPYEIASTMSISDTAVRQAKLRYPDPHPLGGVPLRVERTPRARRRVTLVFDQDITAYEDRIVKFVTRVFEKARDKEAWRRMMREEQNAS